MLYDICMPGGARSVYRAGLDAGRGLMPDGVRYRAGPNDIAGPIICLFMYVWYVVSWGSHYALCLRVSVYVLGTSVLYWKSLGRLQM